MSRTVLNRLLSHSLENYQVLFNELRFHNHNAHHLGSLYLLGVSDDKLEKAYEIMCEGLDSNKPSPHKIDISNWRSYFGDTDCCQSYRDFFREQLTTAGNDWKKKFFGFLLDNPSHPLINGVVGGLAHSLIHIGYALELDSPIVAIEALTMSAVCCDYLHEIVDTLEPPKYPSKSAIEIFKDIHLDNRFPIYDTATIYNLESVIKNCTDLILFYYNQWNMNRENIEKTMEELFDLAVYIYGATHKPNEIGFDFFLAHLLTAMHAVRMIRLHVDNQQVFEHIILQYFYFAIVLYVCQVRPEINEYFIDDYKVENEKKNWDYVLDRLLNSTLMNDAHVVKVIRSLRELEKVYGSKSEFYLKTAVKTVDNFNIKHRWIGISDDERQLNVVKSS
ncbi:unnamed protein product [Rotaria magnacalcarata]|uniref:Uncharacterized protein n=6 Tax=Rotaria magnacalcarata TaxID=392030 RepID=A0A816PZY3_9BILA|nr:unnamed protein product [Rotaria magnacalcarata]CAF2014192.1 unnamed protein product [Rotaria magnacalcarata]CAF2055940.1 unnamed protein product [Rotaria magnacalcarata]CAF3874997.1 unnamed protein product [Rotaria magnacalcarata]CAF4061965.1 unnamed protein product [Rotaria magnacalcarata]